MTDKLTHPDEYMILMHIVSIDLWGTGSERITFGGYAVKITLVWGKGNINKNCLCVTALCTIIMVHKDTSSS